MASKTLKYSIKVDSTVTVEKGMIAWIYDEKDDRIFDKVGIITTISIGSNSFWTAKIDNVSYIWDNKGNCSDGKEANHLYIITTTTTNKEDDKVTRGDDFVIVKDMTLRDNFAISALKVLLDKYDNIIYADDSSITFLCDKAYKIAASMMAASAKNRFEDEQEEDKEQKEEE